MIVQGDDLPFPLVMAAPPAIATVAPTAAPAIAPAEEQPQRAPRRELSLAEKYHNPLCNFMSFRDGIACDCNHEFTREQHEPLTALDFYRWCKHHVYGNADADEGVSPPLHYRVNSVLAWKRAISYSMVNNAMQWNETAQIGNPTCSQLMARLLHHMKQFQMQRRGVASQARRPFMNSEFE